MEEKLGQRVEFSKRAIGKLLQAFDRLLQRNEKLHMAVQDKAEKEKELMMADIKDEQEIKKEPVIAPVPEVKKEPETDAKTEVKEEAEKEAAGAGGTGIS